MRRKPSQSFDAGGLTASSVQRFCDCTVDCWFVLHYSFYTIPGFAEGYLLLKPMVNPPRGESIGCRFDFFGAILSESKYCWQDQSLPHVHTPMQAGATSCHMPIFVAQRVIFAWSPLSQSWCSAPRTTLQAPKTCVWKIMKTNEVISSPNTKCTRIQPLV